jgi:hypothetical protein
MYISLPTKFEQQKINYIRLNRTKKFYFSCSECCAEEITIEVDSSYGQGQELAKIHNFSEGRDEEDVSVYYINITTKQILFRKDYCPLVYYDGEKQEDELLLNP